MIGKKFSRLKVLSPYFGPSSSHESQWRVLCDCGTLSVAKTSALNSGQKKSCGCLRVETARASCQKFKKHGHCGRGWGSRSLTHRTWSSMWMRIKEAARGKKFLSYKNVVICESWKDFKCFLSDMGERPSIKHSIDRIDGSLGYSKENCRWATAKEQARNIKSNHYLTHNGETKIIMDWAKDLGLNPHTLYARINKHKWSVERALTERV